MGIFQTILCAVVIAGVLGFVGWCIYSVVESVIKKNYSVDFWCGVFGICMWVIVVLAILEDYGVIN